MCDTLLRSILLVPYPIALERARYVVKLKPETSPFTTLIGIVIAIGDYDVVVT